MDKNKLKYIREKVMIELSRRSFWIFCLYMFPDFFTEKKKHLKEIAEAFQKVHEGEIKKVIISMPPRAGKSFITSLFCAWKLGKEPNKSIMRNTYSASLANDFSFSIRNLIQTEKYLNVFPHVEVSKEKSKIDGWHLKNCSRPSYIAAGVGGPITGKGASGLAILDDPIKNFEDGMSRVILDKTYDWYWSTHYTRKEGDCAEIIIMTRWNTMDPIGRLLEDSNENEWMEIKIPALVNGESYCEEIISTEDLLNTKNQMDELIWNSLYMQEPANVQGTLFPKSKLNLMKKEDMEETIRRGDPVVLGYTDVADTGVDSLCSVIGYIVNNKIYIYDVIFTKEPVEITEPLVADQLLTHKPREHLIESNNGGRLFARSVNQLIEGKIHTHLNTKTTTQNKQTRILMCSGQIKKYFVFINEPEPNSDYDKFLKEFTSYTRVGKNLHDDSVDAVTGLCEMIIANGINLDERNEEENNEEKPIRKRKRRR